MLLPHAVGELICLFNCFSSFKTIQRGGGGANDGGLCLFVADFAVPEGAEAGWLRLIGLCVMAFLVKEGGRGGFTDLAAAGNGDFKGF